MRVSLVICSALILTLSGSLAQADSGRLASGKPAGLHQAQFEDGNGMLLVAGAALVGIGIALAVAGNDVSQPTQTTPGGSSTTTTATGTNP